MEQRTRISFIIIILIALIALAASPRLASAQPWPALADGVVPTEHAPFAMADLTTSRAVGGELVYSSISADGADGIDVMNLELHGQFEVVPTFFLFGRMPISNAQSPNAPGDDAGEFDLGNLLVGARFISWNQGLRLGGTAAVALPTSPSFNPLRGDDGVAGLLAVLARFDLLGLYLPNTTTYQLYGHVRHDGPRFFVQGELGYERASPRDDGGEPLDVLKVAVGGGLETSDRLTLMAELSNLSMHLEDSADSNEDRLFHWLRAGIRYSVNQMTLGSHVVLALDPVDDALFAWSLAMDISVRF